MTPRDLTALLHLAGFVTGIALYATLAVMALRSVGGGAGSVARAPGNRIALATALLGMAWNAGALVLYGFRDFGVDTPLPWVGALAFSALGFLPAVVVHSAITADPSSAGARRLVVAAYSLSAVAALMHAAHALRGVESPSRPALLALTVGYGSVILAIGLFALHQTRWRRALWVVALAAFAVTALHLSAHATGGESVPAALLGHHASLPLVLVILYQDYRFGLADVFLKRALAFLAVVGLALVLYASVAVPLIFPSSGTPSARAPLAVLALWVATALAYPTIWRLVTRFVDRVVLGRADYQALRQVLAARVEAADSTAEVLDAACAELARAFGTGGVAWKEGGSDPTAAGANLVTRSSSESAAVRVPTSDAPTYLIEVRDLAGGRRLLSDDVAMLDAVALLAARRIDAVRVTEERHARSLREREILQLAAESELRALRAQINPHFLFNALTTIGYLIEAAPAQATRTLYRLTDLLRAVLRRSGDGGFVSLGEELDIVEAYLAIEQARFEERLAVEISVPAALRALRIPPLLLQPLVENAVKHGITPLKRGGRVCIAARLDRGGLPGLEPDGTSGVLRLTVQDTGAGVSAAALAATRESGIGLTNIERRLHGQFGRAGTLLLDSVPGQGTTVELRLPVSTTVAPTLSPATRA